jgi:hypothetical protein
MAITLGTQFQVDTDGDIVRFAGLTSSAGIALYSSAASGIEARHLTNSGGIITGGTVLAIDANAADTMCICQLTATTALIGYAYGATHRVRILTVSGTTLSAAAVTNMSDTGIDFAVCDALTSTKVIYAYNDTAGTNRGTSVILTISGTTVTENASFEFDTFNTDHTAIGAFSDAISAIVFYGGWSQILDISGTTITGNTPFFESGTTTGSAGDNHAALAIDPGDQTLISIATCTGANSGRVQRFVRSGGSLSAPGSPIVLNPGNNVTSISITAIDSDRTILSVLDPTNTQIIFRTFAPSTRTVADTDTTISIAAGASSTEISLLPGSTTAIAVWEDTTEAITASLPGAALTLAAMTKPADVDAAGEFIYVALLEGGTPILTKISTALNADGTTVFNPGAGDKCRWNHGI